MDIIFTSYFTLYPGVKGAKRYKKNNIYYIRSLYDSVKQLGLNMVVFHDQLSSKFIDKYSTDKIRFVKHVFSCKILYMERFYCCLEYLKENKYDKIFILDSGDLELLKDPFPLIDDKIVIGSEEGKIGDSPWMVDVFRKAYGVTYFGDRQMLNPGILGGKFNKMVKLLTLFKDEIKDVKNHSVDMPIFNKLIYDGFEFKTGHPIHTRFNKFEQNTDCYIRHK